MDSHDKAFQVWDGHGPTIYECKVITQYTKELTRKREDFMVISRLFHGYIDW